MSDLLDGYSTVAVEELRSAPSLNVGRTQEHRANGARDLVPGVHIKLVLDMLLETGETDQALV